MSLLFHGCTPRRGHRDLPFHGCTPRGGHSRAAACLWSPRERQGHKESCRVLRSPRIPLLNVAVGTGEGATEHIPFFKGLVSTLHVTPCSDAARRCGVERKTKAIRATLARTPSRRLHQPSSLSPGPLQRRRQRCLAGYRATCTAAFADDDGKHRESNAAFVSRTPFH